MMLLTLPGTPTTYYGEELGMRGGNYTGRTPMDPYAITSNDWVILSYDNSMYFVQDTLANKSSTVATDMAGIFWGKNKDGYLCIQVG